MFILYYEDMRPLSFRLVKGTNMSHVGYSPVSPYGRYHPLNTTCRPGVWVWVWVAAYVRGGVGLGTSCRPGSWAAGHEEHSLHGRHRHNPVYLSHPREKGPKP